MTTDQFPARVRFRPECVADGERLFEILQGSPIGFTLLNPEPEAGVPMAMHHVGGMHWEATVPSREEMVGLVSAMLRVEDGHRLLQTLDAAKDFTGEAFDGNEERAARILPLLGSEDDAPARAYMEVAGVDTEALSGPAPG